MKILQITQHLDIGGLETLVIDLAGRLQNKGIPVEVLCLNNVDEKYISLLRKNDIPLHVIPRKNRLNPSFFIKARSLVKRGKFSLLHAHSGCHTDAFLLAAISNNRPLIFTAHGLPIFTRTIDRIEDSIAACFTKRVIAVSDEIEECLKKWIICPRTRFETIINGIDTNRFTPITDHFHKKTLLRKYNLPKNTFLFGSVGRLEKIKNYEMLIRSAKIIFQKTSAKACLVLVGDGSRFDGLQKISRQLGIADKVIFLGMQYEVHEILPLLDCFTLSSLTEGTSISLLESQSCGIPAVVTSVGGNTTIIEHDYNGYLCEVNDDESMAEYILQLINNAAKTETMGNNARKIIVEKFSITTMTSNYIKIYKKYHTTR